MKLTLRLVVVWLATFALLTGATAQGVCAILCEGNVCCTQIVKQCCSESAKAPKLDGAKQSCCERMARSVPVAAEKTCGAITAPREIVDLPAGFEILAITSSIGCLVLIDYEAGVESEPDVGSHRPRSPPSRV